MILGVIHFFEWLFFCFERSCEVPSSLSRHPKRVKGKGYKVCKFRMP